MPLLNISCLKTDETFKNKQSPARTKRVLKWCFDNLKMNSCQKFSAMVNFSFILITLMVTLILNPSQALEIEESVSINKPIMREVSDLPGWVHFSTEYVRCFCNLPACVSTGYMCKSSGGGCFSDLLDQVNQALPSNVYKGIHGCLELLTDWNQKNWCQNNPSSTSKSTYRKKSHQKSLLLCCYRDMCNHVDSPETRILLNDSVLGEITNDSEDRFIDATGAKPDPALYTESEVWFRAATIAVPICGVVILLVLIALAMRLLKTESSSSSNFKLGMPSYILPADDKSYCEKVRHPGYRHHNIIKKESSIKGSQHHNPIYLSDNEDVRCQTYLPLLIQQESRMEKDCDKKNKTNAKLNFMQELEHCPIEACENKGIPSQNLFHKNTDQLIGRNMILHENIVDPDLNVDKMYNKECIS